MHQRKFVRPALGLIFFSLLSCFVSKQCDAQQEEKAEKKNAKLVTVDQKSIGSVFVVQVKTGNRSSELRYEGRLDQVTDKKLVLVGVTKTARNEQGVPMLRDVPYVARLFKNVGIAMEKVEGPVSIKRKDIIKITSAPKK